MHDRDMVIGSMNGSYLRLRGLDPSNELLGYMALLPGSDEPLWNKDCRAEFFEKFGDSAHGSGVSTGAMHNYWTELSNAVRKAEENHLRQNIQIVSGEVNATLAYQTEPLEEKIDGARPVTNP